MKTIAMIIIAATMAGCGTLNSAGPIPTATALTDGAAAVAAPPGWTAHCIRHPEDPSC